MSKVIRRPPQGSVDYLNLDDSTRSANRRGQAVQNTDVNFRDEDYVPVEESAQLENWLSWMFELGMKEGRWKEKDIVEIRKNFESVLIRANLSVSLALRDIRQGRPVKSMRITNKGELHGAGGHLLSVLCDMLELVAVLNIGTEEAMTTIVETRVKALEDSGKLN